jgi:hypothetical protein
MAARQDGSEGFWIDADVAHTYSRAEALADGVLVDVSEAAREVGIRFPVAVTAAVWGLIEPTARERKRWQQDMRGRIHDVVWILSLRMRAIKRAGDPTDRLTYQVLFRLERQWEGRQRRGGLFTQSLVAVCGPGDHAEPVITIMLPTED